MSKRFLSVLIILVLLALVCVWEQISVDKYLNDIYNQALAIENYVDDITNVNAPELQAMVDRLEDSWDKHESMLCFIINHKDIADISTEITRLKSYSETNQEQDFKATIKVIIHYTDAYHHVMGISLQNLI